MKYSSIILLILTFLTKNFVFSANFFWVNGPGNWSDVNHWSNTSGGASAGSLPTAADNVIFNAASGLTAGSIVNMDFAVTVVNFDFSLASQFTLAGTLPSIEVRGSLIGNNTAVLTYTGAINMFSTAAGVALTSAGRLWTNQFVFTGATNTDGVTLTDALQTTGNISITKGTFLANGKNMSCSIFTCSNGGNRTVSVVNSTIQVTGLSWTVDPPGGGNTLSFLATGSTINLTNTGTVTFNGGGQTYANLNSSALVLNMYGANIFLGNTVLVNSSSLLLENNKLHTFNALSINGTCADKVDLAVILPNQQAATIKVNTSPFNRTGFIVNKVNAQGPTVYNLSNSSVTSSTGWNQIGANYYWINNGGNWTDGNHWSNTSNGPASGCVPTEADSVIFDANSFSLLNQVVLVNDIASFKAMKWIGITEFPVLKLDSNMMAYGDVVFHNNMSLLRNLNPAGIQFNRPGILSPNNAPIDCNFRIKMPNNADLLSLQNALIMSDTSSILMLTGEFNTQNKKVVTGTFQTINDPGSNTETRTLTLGTSQMQTVKSFISESDADFVLNAGTSHLYVGDTIIFIPDTISYSNSLKTNGISFYDVTLNFQELLLNQLVSGNNTFHKLRIVPGSKVSFANNSNQTITDSLIIVGTCADSIKLLSSGAGQFTLTKTGTNVKVQCTKLEDCVITSAQTAYFSTSAGNNGPNWTFNASNPINATFTSSSPDCFGTTTTFSPTPTTQFGEPVTYNWLFNDGSATNFTAQQYSATKTNIVYNFPQAAGMHDTSAVTSDMTGWTELSDPQGLFFPVPGTAYNSPNAQYIDFNVNVNFAMKLNNPLVDSAFLVDMDGSFYPVSYKYKPRLLVFKNGVLYTIKNLVNAPFIQNEGSIPTGLSLIEDTTVNVSITTAILQPSDVLTFRTDVAVFYEGFTTQPRWKNANDTLATDVAVGYQLSINDITFNATPSTNYISGTNTHQFLEQGSFNVVMIATNTVNQCTDTLIQTVDIFAPSNYLSTTQIDTTICAGDSVFFETGSNTNGALFQFFVNGVAQGPASLDTTFATNALNNNDIVYATSTAGGCTSVDNPSYQFVVNPLPVFTLNTSPSTNICAGTMVNFSATPTGSNLYKFQKNNSFVTGYNLLGTYANANLIDNDTITLYGKNTFGCVDTQKVVMNVLPLPNVTFSESSGDYIICAGESVTFTASGANTYEFFINGISQGAPGSATFTTASLTNGNVVSVKGFSIDGCQKVSTTSFTYTVIPLPNVTLTSNSGLSVCSGTNVTFTAGGASTYQFFVNGTAVGPSSVINSISSSSYVNNSTFYVVGSSGGCNYTTPTQTLTVLASPTTALSSSDIDNSICAGTAVTFTGAGASTYQFLINGVAQTPNSANSTFTSSTLQNGNVVSLIGFANGCSVSQQLTMTVLNNPNVLLFSTDPNNTICVGENITFTGANASQYQLFVNGIAAGGQQASASFANPTLTVGNNSVYVVGTSANGCSGQSSPINTLVNSNPSVNLTSSDADNTICAGQTVTFTGSGASQYQFFVNGVSQGALSANNALTLSNLTNGQTVTVNGNSLGCSTTSTGIVTIVNPVPNVTLSSTQPSNNFCVGSPVVFTASGATSYQFFVNGTSQGPAGAVNTLNAASFIVGTYPVLVTGVQSGCSASVSQIVTVNPLPTATIISNDPDNTICSGQPVTYTAGTGNTYLFSINGTPQGAANPLNTFVSSVLTNGAVVSAQVISPQGCSSTATMPAITVNPIPVVTLSSSDPNQQICVSENVTFTGNGASLYEFFVNGVSQGTPSATNTFSTSALANGQNVSVTGTSLGCSSTPAPLTFTVFGPPSVQLFNNGSTTLCAGQGVNLQANGASSYQFTVNGIPAGPFGATSTFTAPVSNSDVVSVIGQTNGCNNPSATSFTFTVLNYPVLSSSPSDPDLNICQGDLITFTSSGASTYDIEWNGIPVQSSSSPVYTNGNIENGDIVTITGLNGTCASVPLNFAFTVNSLGLNLTATPGTLICEGQSVTFTANGADSYEFFVNGVSQGSPSTNQTFTLVNPVDGDEVTMIASSNATGCQQNFGTNMQLDVIPNPSVTASSGPDFCEGDSVTLTSNQSNNLQWLLNGNPISGATDSTLVVYQSGDYSLSSTTGGNGELWSVGLNAQGIFANDANLNSTIPVQAVGGISFAAVSAGDGFMLGLTPTGEVYSWGANGSGQLGNGTFTASNDPIPVASLTAVQSVATTAGSSYAVTSSGNVFVWGNNSLGQLGTGNTSVINFPFQLPSLTNVDSIAAGKQHVVVLKNDGTVWTMGNNAFGQLGNGNLNNSFSPIQVPGLTNIIRVGASEQSSFAISGSGDLFVWGKNTSGQLGLGDINNRLSPALSSLRHIVHAEGGANHSVFLTNSKKVYSAGNNDFGQLGDGTTNASLTPIESTITGVTQVSASEYNTLFLRLDQSVYGSGSNIENQIAESTVQQVLSPDQITTVHGVDFIEMAKTSAHYIYGNSTGSCTSAPVSLNMLPVPQVTISESGGLLTTVSGDSYQWFLNGAPLFEGNQQTYIPLVDGYYTVSVTFSNGCTGTSDNFPFGNVGLEEENLQMELFPNPTTGLFYIRLDGLQHIVIRMRDLSGRLILEQEVEKQNGLFHVQTDVQATGNYLVEVLHEGKSMCVKRIVVEDSHD